MFFSFSCCFIDTRRGLRLPVHPTPGWVSGWDFAGGVGFEGRALSVGGGRGAGGGWYGKTPLYSWYYCFSRVQADRHKQAMGGNGARLSERAHVTE